ncbi:MAG: molybdopterin-dependent oxidoreductase [Candidatus Alkaliphilus sp. MAG34]
MEASETKLTNKIIVIIIICLVIIVGIFLYLNSRMERLNEGEIRIKAGNNVMGIVTLEDVKQLPSVKKKLAINSTLGITKHQFTCTPLSEIFNRIDPGIVNEYKKIVTIGVDNYASAIKMDEVLEKNNVYLVYEDNGKPLKSKTGEEGTMRVVILNDIFGQRFTNFLVEMRLE